MCKIIPACLNFPGIVAASHLHSAPACQSVIFRKIGKDYCNLCGIILHDCIWIHVSLESSLGPPAKARTSQELLDLTVDPVIMMMTSPLLLLTRITLKQWRRMSTFTASLEDDSPYFRPFELCQQQTKSARLASHIPSARYLDSAVALVGSYSSHLGYHQGWMEM